MSEKILHKTTLITPDGVEEILLGGGCFWCIEPLYLELRGITKVESGYANGFSENPNYRAVCTGMSGYAEVIKVTFDPTVISLADVLSVFFTVHDPTTLNRQGNDAGTQYRSAIYYFNDAQKTICETIFAEANEKIWDGKIVTELAPMSNYYVAETYHQNYYNINPNEGYCSYVITPKVGKFRKLWADKLK